MQCILSWWFGHWRTESRQGAGPPPPTAPEAVADNLRCHQRRLSRHHGNSRPSVDVLRVEISAKANLPLSQIPPPRRRDAWNATSVFFNRPCAADGVTSHEWPYFAAKPGCDPLQFEIIGQSFDRRRCYDQICWCDHPRLIRTQRPNCRMRHCFQMENVMCLYISTYIYINGCNRSTCRWNITEQNCVHYNILCRSDHHPHTFL